MGGNSTLQSAVLGDTKVQSPSAFDLQSWQGLTHILNVARTEINDPQAYADFRNLVLEYAQKGGDHDIRKQVDAIIKTFVHGAVTEVENVPPREEVVVRTLRVETAVPTPVVTPHGDMTPDTSVRITPNGTRRIQPRFSPVHITPSIEREEAAVAPSVSPIPDVVSEREHAFDSTISLVETQEVPSELEVHEEEELSETVPTQVAFKSIDEHKARIAEIKRSVHEHIGNPAALLDTHDALGKTYMTALLTALKATGAGSEEAIGGAMNRLEEAYQALTESSQKGAVTQQAKEVVVPKVDVAVEVETSPAPVAETLVPHTEIAKEDPVVPIAPYDEPIPTEEVDVPLAHTLEVAHDPVPKTPSTPSVPKKSSPASFLASFVAEEELDKVPTSIPTLTRTPVARDTDTHAYIQETAEQEGQHTLPQTMESDLLLHESGIDPELVAVRQGELASPEITEALNQLLHEWSIFNGGGLFGIGPEGSENPLYIKLATLSMGEVLSGRWEGSSPKTIKVIKEYVDAWRHEQSIAYTTNETFEHYLRRVVQRILKRQQSGA